MRIALVVLAVLAMTGTASAQRVLADTELAAAAALADNTANPTIPGVAAFTMCWDGATWDRCAAASADTELPAAAALADNTANPTVPGVASFNMCWDGTNWDRCPTGAGGAGAVSSNTARTVEASDSPITVSLDDVEAAIELLNPKFPTAATITDNFANPSTTGVASFNMCWDGTNWDRCPTGAGGAGAVTSNTSRVVLGNAAGCYLVSAASTNATSCKASAGYFYGVRVVNMTATPYYLRMYNLASAPTCSSATGFIESIPIPASTTGAGVVALQHNPIPYTAGISFCFTGGAAGTDNTNAATGVYGAVIYE